MVINTNGQWLAVVFSCMEKEEGGTYDQIHCYLMSGNIPDVGCFNLQTLSGPRHVLWFDSQSIKFGNSTHEQEAVHQQ